jgi:hypothetical protein
VPLVITAIDCAQNIRTHELALTLTLSNKAAKQVEFRIPKTHHDMKSAFGDAIDKLVNWMAAQEEGHAPESAFKPPKPATAHPPKGWPTPPKHIKG